MGEQKMPNKQECDNREISVIHWKSPKVRPDNGSYVLLKCLDEEGTVVCEYCAYENGCFIYTYDGDTWGEINEDIIIGWSYLPFDHH